MAVDQSSGWKSTLESIQNFQVEDINNIDWENMGSWPLPGKVVFIVLVFSAVIALGYFLLIESNQTRLVQVEQKEEQLKQEFENKAFRGANLEKYKTQLMKMEKSFGSLLKQLPRDTEVPGLLDDISSAALGAGLKLNAINPQGVNQTEFYNELPIEVEVEGGYHEMGSFVSAVASLPRIVTLHDFSIEKVKDQSLKMTIMAKTYQYRSGGAK